MKSDTRLVRLDSLFTISHGNKLDENKMGTPNDPNEAVAFVGRSGERNGVVAMVRSISGSPPFPAGAITVALGGAALSSFVQPRQFYTAQNIDVLTPKQEMSLDMKLYYCQCIEANRFRYSTFGREANRTLKALMVPARDQVPQWVEGICERSLQSLVTDLKRVL